MNPGRPAVSTIAAGVSFVDALAEGLLAQLGEDPLALSAALVLLPTRRACRALQDAFLRVAEGRPLALPRCLPLGDLDLEELALAGDEGLQLEAPLDLPPALPALRRQLLLARLVQKLGAAAGGPLNEEQAVRLAAELARFLDQVETEGLGLDRLEALVPDAYAEHWQITLTFLDILRRAWPAVLAEEGAIGPAERRRRLLEAQAAVWRRDRPQRPIVAAGSTGSIPATAALLATVARLPAGQVVLPPLDRDADPETWALIREDPAHPQHGLARLLETLEVEREAVADWPAPVTARAELRSRLVNWALRPAAATAGWLELSSALPEAEALDAFKDIARIDCPGPGEEATVVALILRQALETEGQTAALITPDRGLARRVAAELRRWEVEVDDSAGQPLGSTPPGTFLRLLAKALAAELAPVPLLELLKHPLAACGRAPGTFRQVVRALERRILRGPRPPAGLAGLRSALKEQGASKELFGLLRDLEAALGPLLKLRRGETDLARLVAAQVAAAEALAATPDLEGTARLWAGEAGEAAAGFLSELLESAAAGPPVSLQAYPGLLEGLLAGQAVRPRFGRHPRLHIWGPLEARLQHADVVVLGGLNEGTWPAEVESGPWLSRPMRRDFGLAPPERRIGLAAQDFAQAFTAPRLFLTRAERVEGTPTVPSRWLLRLEALRQALLAPTGQPEATPELAAGAQWLAWAEELDRPLRFLPSAPPAPRPPLEARPRRLSVTQVETWRRDPYAVYARHVLKLRALDPLQAEPGPAERGTMIHRALEAFLEAWPQDLPDDTEAELLKAGAAVFEPLRANPGAYAFWWSRYRRIAGWLAGVEAERRGDLVQILAEAEGRLEIAAPGGPFILTAKADRLERHRDGRLGILDYKTGQVPSKLELELGYAPQLPLEAAIASEGGFASLPAGEIAELAFLRLSGGQPPGTTAAFQDNAAALAEAARAGLEVLIARFDRPETPYHAVPWALRAPAYSDYAHLARIKEWSAGVAAEGSE